MSDGLNHDRLAELLAAMEEDVRQGLYFGGVIKVARHGKVGLHAAFGHADAHASRKVEKDSVFSLFSVTKAFTNVLVYRAIEAGRLALTTKVVSVIPEFAGGMRDDITLFHLLTHTSGMPSLYTPKPGMYIDRLGEIVAAICELVRPDVKAGERLDYSPLISHAMMGEMVVRVDAKQRRFRDILQQDILDPLKLKDTSMGLRRDLKPRHLVPDFRGNTPIDHLGHSDLGPNGAFEEEDAEMPWVGIASTADDLFRFAEMLRRGGELDGARIVSPTFLKRARQNWTGDKPNEVYKRMAENLGWQVMPGYIGLGFSLRGHAVGNTLFGNFTSPETFGNYGAGTTIFWVDPELDMTFVALCTGVMTGADNILRWRRLSDMAVSAAV